MASSSERNRPLTRNELEEEAQCIMDSRLNSDSEFSDDESEHSDHETDSEQENIESDLEIAQNEKAGEEISESSDDVETEASSGNYFYGKNRFKWAKTCPALSRTRKHNIVSHLPGIVGEARAAKPTKPKESWKCLISRDILQIIVERTNERITHMAAKYDIHNLSCQYTNHVDSIEMNAFLGLLYLAGVFKSNNEDLKSLFATDGTGRDIFRATMSLNRFYFLLSALCFDNSSTRPQRIENGDKLAAISEVFDIFITNCQSNYSCGEYLTIDEMLIAFRGRCRFRMYLKNKPDKYGIKMQCLVDAKTHYLLNAFIYIGKDTHTTNPRKLAIPTLDVLRLAATVSGTNRNITCDNWFSSLELVSELKKNQLTYVGTIRKNKREIPPQFQPQKDRSLNSSLFGFTKDETLVAHVPKKNRSVLLLSSMHHSDTIINGKPEIIAFYNATKGGVDALDKKCACYKVGRRTRRWPQVIFFRILDIAGVNSNIIYNGVLGNKEMDRRSFLTCLGRELIQEHVQRRVHQQFLPKELRALISKISGVPEPTPITADQGQQSKKRGRCYFCPYSKNQKKESMSCNVCKKFLCKNHGLVTIRCQICEDR